MFFFGLKVVRLEKDAFFLFQVAANVRISYLLAF